MLLYRTKIGEPSVDRKRRKEFGYGYPETSQERRDRLKELRLAAVTAAGKEQK